MTLNNLPTQLTALLFSIAFTTTVLAQTESIDENEGSSANNVASETNPAININSDINNKVNTGITKQAETQEKTTDTQIAIPCSQMSSYQKNKPQTMVNREMEKFQQMEKQWYKQRRETFKKNLENRNQQMSVDTQSRRDEFIKHMEQRREFFDKMNNQRRKDFEQRRIDLLHKMHQTSTDSASINNT